MTIKSNILNDLISILLPPSCFGCNAQLIGGEVTLCTICRHQLPYTRHNYTVQNSLDQKFMGLVDIHKSAALLILEKENITQKLLYQLKYNHQEHLSSFFAYLALNIYAEELQQLNINTVIPVPLHKAKRRKRGYNQVDNFGKIIAQHLEAPFYPDGIIKTKNTKSQTSKNRWARQKNTKEIFMRNPGYKLKNKNVLLVDDVLTTGSTLESCANAILYEQPRCIYSLTIAAAVS